MRGSEIDIVHLNAPRSYRTREQCQILSYIENNARSYRTWASMEGREQKVNEAVQRVCVVKWSPNITTTASLSEQLQVREQTHWISKCCGWPRRRVGWVLVGRVCRRCTPSRVHHSRPRWSGGECRSSIWWTCCSRYHTDWRGPTHPHWVVWLRRHSSHLTLLKWLHHIFWIRHTALLEGSKRATISGYWVWEHGCQHTKRQWALQTDLGECAACAVSQLHACVTWGLGQPRVLHCHQWGPPRHSVKHWQSCCAHSANGVWALPSRTWGRGGLCCGDSQCHGAASAHGAHHTQGCPKAGGSRTCDRAGAWPKFTGRALRGVSLCTCNAEACTKGPSQSPSQAVWWWNTHRYWRSNQSCYSWWSLILHHIHWRCDPLHPHVPPPCKERHTYPLSAVWGLGTHPRPLHCDQSLAIGSWQQVPERGV